MRDLVEFSLKSGLSVVKDVLYIFKMVVDVVNLVVM